jgi:hypothetical protein
MVFLIGIFLKVLIANISFLVISGVSLEVSSSKKIKFSFLREGLNKAFELSLSLFLGLVLGLLG